MQIQHHNPIDGYDVSSVFSITLDTKQIPETKWFYSTLRIHEVHLAITELVFQGNFCTSHSWKVPYHF
jgi:hypothetical protein